ncbi:MAG: glycosyltransferase family 4 protein [Gemmatimonadaceae bacterium]|nr:glycosyltransferase family 4 protein [Gemmatimonadaceae bacterium]
MPFDQTWAHVAARDDGLRARIQSREPSRLLYVASAPPVPSKIGPARRNFHVIDQLSRFYDVTVLAPGSALDASRFADALGRKVAGVHFAPVRLSASRKFAWKIWRTACGRCDFVPAGEAALRRLCSSFARKESFDAVVLSNALLHTLPIEPGMPVIGDTHNVEFDLLQRLAETSSGWARRVYSRRQSKATREEERRAASRVELLLATSERDRTLFVDMLDAPRVDVIMNGIALDEFTPASVLGEPGEILFTGLMSYFPNQQGLRWFLERVFPLVRRRVPNARLVAAGASPPKWLRKRAEEHVLVTGAVEDMRPFLARARVTIAPLLTGGGTRVKILEANAVGRPVVSTAIGAEGLGVRDGDSILLADDPEQFAHHVIAVLSDDALARRLSVAGRAYVTQNHDWDRIGERLSGVLRDRIGLTPRSRAPLQDLSPLIDYVAE